MSSAVVSTSSALGRPFLFDDDPEAKARPDQIRPFPGAKKPAHTQESAIASIQSTINNQQSTISLTPASHLEIRPAPEMASSGIAALDALTGGLPRGCLTEICGPASSGRTTVLLAALAAATTRRGEYCALIDASDALDPHSIAAAGVDLSRLLWVRCGESSPQKALSPRTHRDTEKTNSKAGCPISREPFAREVGISSQTAVNFGETNSRAEHCLEQVLRSTDLLLESGGFGLIVLDLADLPPQSARRIPLTTWFRFRRAVEHKPTILLAIEQHPIAGSCSSLRLQLGVPSTQYPVTSSKPSHTNLLTELQIRTELVHSRLERKPSRSISFESKTAWAG
jgi:recombination protein RecA